jgi:UTP--glucose-1-phosphate uridylyltransferase
MKVTTAVISAAGYGSRMLPVTAAVQKELLPILDRPVIDYLVADLVTSGITHIIFVISPGSHGLQDYYTGNPVLEAHLERFGKHTAIERLRAIHDQATFTFVEQPESAGYGTAIPLQVAIPHLPKNEAFIVCYGDAFLTRDDGPSDMQRLVDAFTTTEAAGALVGIEMPDADLHRYGVLGVESRQGDEYLTELVEKPTAEEAPSNLINHGLYILTPQLLPYVKQVKLHPKLQEYLLTDAIQAAAHEHPLLVYRAGGRWLDAGSLTGWMEANLVMASTHPELAKVITSNS